MGKLEEQSSDQQETQLETSDSRPDVDLNANHMFSSALQTLTGDELLIAGPPEIDLLTQHFAHLESITEVSVDTYIDNTVMVSPISYLVNEHGDPVEVLNTSTLTQTLLDKTTESGGKIVDMGPLPGISGGSTLADLIQDSSPEGTLAIKSLITGMLAAGGYTVLEEGIQFYKKERVIIAEVETDEKKLFVKLVEPGTGEQELLGAERAGSELPAVSAEKLVRTSAYEALVQPYIEAIGHDKGVMADLISHYELEEDPLVRSKLVDCIHDIYSAIHSWSSRTMDYTEGPARNDIFYHDRLAPDGRINQYYQQATFQLGDEVLSWNELLDMRWTIDGVDYEETLGELLEKAKRDLNPHTTRLLCNSHGDSTEMNLISNGIDVAHDTDPQDHVFGMIDLETVGSNDALGDGINHLVYLTVKGGFSVPKYYPEVLQDRPGVIQAYETRDVDTPTVAPEVARDKNTLHLTNVEPLPIGDARTSLAKHFVESHLEPLLDRVEAVYGQEARQATEARLGSYMLMRFIGVHNVSTWESQDQVKLLTTLMKTCGTPCKEQTPATTLQRFLSTLPEQS